MHGKCIEQNLQKSRWNTFLSVFLFQIKITFVAEENHDNKLRSLNQVGHNEDHMVSDLFYLILLPGLTLSMR